jgi:hypothetical protein
MADIPAAVYILVGLVVTIASIFIAPRGADDRPLIFFIYIGIIMMVWGLGKYGYRKVTAPKKVLPTKQVPIQPHRAQVVHHHAHHAERCPHCGNTVAPHDNFCGRCGARRIRA